MSRLMADEASQHGPGEALRRHKALALLCVLLVGGLVGAYAYLKPPSFTSTVQVLVRPTLGNPFSPDTGASGQQVTIAMSTEAAVVDSRSVADLANKHLDQPWQPGSGVVKATVPPNTQVVQISFRADNAADAQHGASAVAQAYLDYRHGQTESTQKTRLETLRRQVTAVSKSLQRATEEAQATDRSPDTVQQVQLYANQLATLQTTINSVEAAGADPGSLIAPAPRPSGPSGLDPRLLLGAGLLVGLGVAVMVALWRERADRRVRGDSDLAVAGLPILARPGRSSRVLAHGIGRTTADMTYSRLRTAVLAKVPVGSCVAVTGMTDSVDSEGPAIDLGTSLSRSGYRVCVLVASGRPLDEAPLAGNPHAGTEQSVDRVAAKMLRQDIDGVSLLRLASRSDELDELVSTPEFPRLLAALRKEYDYLVIAAPPASGAADLAAVRHADATLLLALDRGTTVEQVEELQVRAAHLGVALIGMALLDRRQGPSPLAGASSGRGGGRTHRHGTNRPTDDTAELADNAPLQT